MYEQGIAGMRYSHQRHRRVRRPDPRPARHRRPRARDHDEILAEIQTGEFAREWILENQAGRPGLQRPGKRQGKEHLIETVGKELRGMMSWIDEGGLDIDV